MSRLLSLIHLKHVVNDNPPLYLLLFLNGYFFLQCCVLTSLFYFLAASAPFSLWLIGGFFLVVIGFIGLILQLDIFIGFLWVIDFGVGLIFLVFLAHMVTFMETAPINSSKRLSKLFYLVILLVISLIVSLTLGASPSIRANNLLLLPTLINYYLILSDYQISQLNLLREIFFYNNSWEFIVINYVVLLGLMGLIIFNFSLRELFQKSSGKAVIFQQTLASASSQIFIRDQNFIQQQHTSTSSRVWIRKTNSNTR